jgi:hypothetical protein
VPFLIVENQKEIWLNARKTRLLNKLEPMLTSSKSYLIDD